MQTIGTSHFKSRAAAVRSYFLYFGSTSVAEAAREVDYKLKQGEISIGPPRSRKGWEVVLDGEEGRYKYRELAKRCTPAKEIPF